MHTGVSLLGSLLSGSLFSESVGSKMVGVAAVGGSGSYAPRFISRSGRETVSDSGSVSLAHLLVSTHLSRSFRHREIPAFFAKYKSTCEVLG